MGGTASDGWKTAEGWQSSDEVDGVADAAMVNSSEGRTALLVGRRRPRKCIGCTWAKVDQLHCAVLGVSHLILGPHRDKQENQHSTQHWQHGGKIRGERFNGCHDSTTSLPAKLLGPFIGMLQGEFCMVYQPLSHQKGVLE